MSLSHYVVCLNHEEVLPSDVVIAYLNKAQVPVFGHNCGYPTTASAKIYLRPYEDFHNQEEQFNDGLAIGWAVVAAMAAAWSIQYLRRAL